MVKIELNQKSNSPLYLQIHDAISQEIVSGRLAPNEKLPTENELARSLGVHRLTISRGYAALERKGLLQQKRGKGSYIAPNATEILGVPRQRRFRNIGFILGASDVDPVPFRNKFIVYDFLTGISARLQQSRIKLTHLLISDKPDMVPSLVDDQLAHFDGCLITASLPVVETFHRLAQKLNIPCVLLGAESPWPQLPSVTWDCRQGISLAADHLVRCGYRRLGYVANPHRPEQNQYNFKIKHFLDELHHFGIDVEPQYRFEVNNIPGEAQRAISEMLKRGDKPEAFFVDTDYKAMEVACAVQTLGLAIPDDIAIVGFDGLPETSSFRPPLTTVYVPRGQIGFRATDLLLQWLPDNPPPPSVLLTSELVVRESTRLPVVEREPVGVVNFAD